MRYLLDTHILLWWLQGKSFSTKIKKILEEASPDQPLLVSDITLWEVAMLHNLKRIELDRPLQEWLAMATAPPLIMRHRISPAIAAQISELPESFHRDPADRILVATAKIMGAAFVTLDKKIVNAKVVRTIS